NPCAPVVVWPSWLYEYNWLTPERLRHDSWGNPDSCKSPVDGQKECATLALSPVDRLKERRLSPGAKECPSYARRLRRVAPSHRRALSPPWSRKGLGRRTAFASGDGH